MGSTAAHRYDRPCRLTRAVLPHMFARSMPQQEPLGPAAIGSYMGNVGRVAGAEEHAIILFLAPGAASNISGTILPWITAGQLSEPDCR